MKAPELEDVAETLLDQRGRSRSHTALVLPITGAREALRKHIRALKGQSSNDFDLILVYGPDEGPERLPEGMGALHLRERRPVGPAGAFYIGQRAALEGGYANIILADSDAVPESDGLIAGLVSAASGGLVSMPMVDYGGSRRPRKGTLLNHYGCLPRAALEKAGLSFLPLAMGGEEIELLCRVRASGTGVANVDAVVSHPARMPLAITPPRTLYHYQRGLAEGKLLGGHYACAFRAIASDLLLGSAFLLLGRVQSANAFFLASWHASGLEFGIRSGFAEAGNSGANAPQAAGMAGLMVVDAGTPIPVAADFLDRFEGGGPARRAAGRLEWVFRYFTGSPKAFGRDILLRGRSSPFLDLPLLLLSRSAVVEWSGKRHAITHGRGAIRICAGAAAFIIAAPALLAVSAALLMRGMLAKAASGKSSYRYGLPVRRRGSAPNSPIRALNRRGCGGFPRPFSERPGCGTRPRLRSPSSAQRRRGWRTGWSRRACRHAHRPNRLRAYATSRRA